MLTICSLLSCLLSRQLTNERCPAANPLPVKTVGTFIGPRQELRRYQGGRRRRRSCSSGKKKRKNPVATASVRVIPVIPVLLWQQARALVEKIKNKEKEKEKDYVFNLKILRKTLT